jgi:tryptophanyl-tRNA synthetase
MLEQAREIVRSFNGLYGETLVEPKAVLPENKSCLRLPGTDGMAKMSKSLGNCIYLSDSADEIRQKVMGMFTDPNHLRVTDPGDTKNNPTFIYLDAFATDEHFAKYAPEYANLDEMKAHYERGGLGDMKVKKLLNAVMQETLEPIRQRREEFAKDIPAVWDMLYAGSQEAKARAAQTLSEVKKAMKIDYFTGRE